MRCTLTRDDIPLLSQWIKNRQVETCRFLVEVAGLAIESRFRQNAFWRARSFLHRIMLVTASLRPKNTPPECFCLSYRHRHGLSIPGIYLHQTKKSLAALFPGGGGGNRTRVRKPLNATFSGCRVSTVFPGSTAGTQAVLLGSLLVHDRYKSKLTVHVRC